MATEESEEMRKGLKSEFGMQSGRMDTVVATEAV